MQIISRKEAIEKGLSKYFTGNPCKYGHFSERFVSTNTCVQCAKEKDNSINDKLKNETLIDNRPLKEKISRKEAIEKGFRYYFNKPCKNNHYSEKDVVHRQCIQCLHENYKKNKYITKEEALKKGLETYYDGEICENNHDCVKLVKNDECYYCNRENEKIKKEKLNHKELNTYWPEGEYISRDYAIDNKLKYYNTNTKCKNGHYSPRYTLNRNCVECSMDYTKDHYKLNKQKVLERSRKRREDNPDRIRAYTAKYRSKKLKATPNWLTNEDYEQIKRIYQEAHNLSVLTGLDFHVDHIIPLQNDYVCGLHTPQNLQILPYYENLKKGNKIK